MISRFFISRPIFACALSVLVLIAGIVGYVNLPVEQFPNVAPPVVTINTEYTGASAEAVMKSVVTYTVSLAYDARIYVRELNDIVPHDKERSPYAVLLENIQYSRCRFGYRPVVKREIHNRLAVMQQTCIAAPSDTAVQVLHPRRELVQYTEHSAY